MAAPSTSLPSVSPRSAARGALGGGRFFLFPHFLSRVLVTPRQQREEAALGETKGLGVTVEAQGPGRDRGSALVPSDEPPPISVAWGQPADGHLPLTPEPPLLG